MLLEGCTYCPMIKMCYHKIRYSGKSKEHQCSGPHPQEVIRWGPPKGGFIHSAPVKDIDNGDLVLNKWGLPHYFQHLIYSALIE